MLCRFIFRKALIAFKVGILFCNLKIEDPSQSGAHQVSCRDNKVHTLIPKQHEARTYTQCISLISTRTFFFILSAEYIEETVFAGGV